MQWAEKKIVFAAQPENLFTAFAYHAFIIENNENGVPQVIKKYDKCGHCQKFEMQKIHKYMNLKKSERMNTHSSLWTIWLLNSPD